MPPRTCQICGEPTHWPDHIMSLSATQVVCAKRERPAEGVGRLKAQFKMAGDSDAKNINENGGGTPGKIARPGKTAKTGQKTLTTRGGTPPLIYKGVDDPTPSKAGPGGGNDPEDPSIP